MRIRLGSGSAIAHAARKLCETNIVEESAQARCRAGLIACFRPFRCPGDTIGQKPGGPGRSLSRTYFVIVL